MLYLLRKGPRAFQNLINSYLCKPKLRADNTRDQAMAMNASILGLKLPMGRFGHRLPVRDFLTTSSSLTQRAFSLET